MALWFLCTLLFTIFSGLYFALDKDRLTPNEDYKTAFAGLFDNCRRGGVAQSQIEPLFGFTPIADVRNCNGTDLSVVQQVSLDVPGVKVLAVNAKSVDPTQTSLTKRMVVAYILPGNVVMNGIPFNEAARQIRATFADKFDVGIVATVNGIHQIQNGALDQVRVPTLIPDGAIAAVTIVN